MAYFLISLANRGNLDLCIDYAMAGFTNSINGAWTFVEIDEGDYISFLYGARAHNLYQVEKKIALKDAHKLPPWPSVTFRMSGHTYYFPYRLLLKPVRELSEPLVRAEFAYVAENLLLRGGYRRTHFQADQTTLQSVSQMGTLWNRNHCDFDFGKYDRFEPAFTKNRSLLQNPEVLLFQEVILQSGIRHHLSDGENLQNLLRLFGIELPSGNFEVLGEKALPEGHVDILVKESIPIGQSRKILIEIKTGSCQKKDIDQIASYVNEVGDECVGGILIASKFPKRSLQYAKENSIFLAVYDVSVDLNGICTFQQILESLRLIPAVQ